MRILFICFEFPPCIGGGSSYNENLVKSLSDTKNEVVVVTSGAEDVKETVNNFLVVRRFKNIQNLYEGRGNVLAVIDDIINVIRESKPDIIHSQQYLETLAAQVANKNFCLPLVVSHHKTPEYRSEITKKNSKWSCFDFVNTRLVSHYIPSSDAFLKTLLKTTNSIDKKQITKIYPGVSSVFKKIADRAFLDDFRLSLGIKEYDRLILLPLKIRKRKGLEFIRDCVRDYGLSNKNIKVLITGLPDDDNYGKKIIKSYKETLGDIFIEHKNGFSNQEMLYLYNISEVAVLPSESEGLGLSLIEAMSCGCPVIGTNVQGIKEIIQDGLNGRLVEYGNSTDMLNALSDVIDGNKKLYVENAYKTVASKFNSTKQAEGHIRVYRENIENRTTSAGVVLYRSAGDEYEIYACLDEKRGCVLPGGDVKSGETLTECASRCAKGEAGYDVFEPVFSLGELSFLSGNEEKKLFNKTVHFFAYEVHASQAQSKYKAVVGERTGKGEWYKKNEVVELLKCKGEADKVLRLFDMLQPPLTEDVF